MHLVLFARHRPVFCCGQKSPLVVRLTPLYVGAQMEMRTWPTQSLATVLIIFPQVPAQHNGEQGIFTLLLKLVRTREHAERM